jgi:hypothetical protein
MISRRVLGISLGVLSLLSVVSVLRPTVAPTAPRPMVLQADMARLDTLQRTTVAQNTEVTELMGETRRLSELLATRQTVEASGPTHPPQRIVRRRAQNPGRVPTP